MALKPKHTLILKFGVGSCPSVLQSEPAFARAGQRVLILGIPEPPPPLPLYCSPFPQLPGIDFGGAS